MNPGAEEPNSNLALSDLANIATINDLEHLLIAAEGSSVDIATPGATDKPRTWQEAKLSGDSGRWETAYHEKLESLKEMSVYKLIPQSKVPVRQRVRSGQPVFKIKRDENGKAVRFKVRLVFRGYKQIQR